MDIEKIGPNLIPKSVSETSSADQNGKVAEGRAMQTRKGDEVTLSAEAQLLLKALRTLQATPDVREGLVAELRQRGLEGVLCAETSALRQMCALLEAERHLLAEFRMDDYPALLDEKETHLQRVSALARRRAELLGQLMGPALGYGGGRV